ncbi:hypothetical protein Lal_00001828 [Lupinus albus]|nr:hypothetical protein Lal_00001828 [Lupinus albus]
MNERTLVPIFFVWALLTIVTPTLIFLSENSKADLHLNGNYTSEGMKARKMFGYTQNDDIIRTLPSLPKSVEAEEEVASASASAPAPAPAPAPEPTPNSLHNHSLITNMTDYGFTLSSPNKQDQVQ